VLYWLLDYDAAGIPGPSSIIEPFFSIKENLGNPFIDGVVLESFRSVLAFPVWLFNPNNGGNIELESQVISPNLPKEFYTRASTVAPYVKLKFDPVFLLLFVIFQGTVLALLWLLLLWAFFTAGTLPVISSYAQFDISFKAEVGGPLGVEVDPFDTRVAGDSKILKMMDGVKVKSVPRIGAVGVTSRVGGE
jgi:hypothetical protein